MTTAGGEQPTYEAARAELRDVVGKLEAGGQSLEESLALWERGEALADICRHWLDDATERLDTAIAEHDADGPSTAGSDRRRGADAAPGTDPNAG